MNEAYLETALCFNPVLSKEGAIRLEDGSWRMVIEAAEAKEVSIRLDEKEYPFTRDGEGIWILDVLFLPVYQLTTFKESHESGCCVNLSFMRPKQVGER